MGSGVVRNSLVGVVIALLHALSACGSPAQGSREDLAARIDELQAPPVMRPLSDHYNDCSPQKTPCPSLVRWLELDGPIEAIKGEFISSLRARGFDPRPNSVDPNLLTMPHGDYLYFIVFGGGSRYPNDPVPSNVDVELIVTHLDKG
jgi:hypothetical protein